MKTKHLNSTASKFSVLRQLCNLIPTHEIAKIVTRHDSDRHARDFSHHSQIVALMYSKLTHSFGLNDLCDQLQLHSGPLSTIRGATPPHRNTLSHANKVRPAEIAQDLYWKVWEQLQLISPRFGKKAIGRRLRGLHRNISIIDSTTMELVANCVDWAEHRRGKAAAKAHVRLNFDSLLPACAVIDTARESDCKRARDLTAGLKSGEICIFDRGYIDLEHFRELDERGVVFVTRWKTGMTWKLEESRDVSGKTLSDEVVILSNNQKARKIRALVEVDGMEREMEFLTNDLEWSAATIVDLYRMRWQIEVFFKQMKQTLKLCDFVGNSANAIRWQVWTALLVHLLIRYQAWLSSWSHSYVRLFALIRGVVWEKRDLGELLKRHGTAGGSFRNMARPEQAYLAGFS